MLVDLGYTDIHLKMAEDRNGIDFRVCRKPEELGRYSKHLQECSARFGPQALFALALVNNVTDDVVEGSFLVRFLDEVCEDSAELADDGEEWPE